MKPNVYRVVKYDGLFTKSVGYTWTIETAINIIERQIALYLMSYTRSTVKRIWDREPPVAVLTLRESNGLFVREWQYTIIKIKVM